MTKDDLMKEVWPDAFVEEANLTQNIFALRKILGESTSQYIETVPRRGYRFVAPVRRFPASTLAAPVDLTVEIRRANDHTELLEFSPRSALCK